MTECTYKEDEVDENEDDLDAGRAAALAGRQSESWQVAAVSVAQAERPLAKRLHCPLKDESAGRRTG